MTAGTDAQSGRANHSADPMASWRTNQLQPFSRCARGPQSTEAITDKRPNPTATPISGTTTRFAAGDTTAN